MNIREALTNKKMSSETLRYRINSWGIYGEDTLILFYKNPNFSTETLDKLIDYLALADKLVLAMPKGTDEETIFHAANLQVVDAIVLFDDVKGLINAQESAKLAFEDIDIPTLSADEKNRLISL